MDKNFLEYDVDIFYNEYEKKLSARGRITSVDNFGISFSTDVNLVFISWSKLEKIKLSLESTKK